MIKGKDVILYVKENGDYVPYLCSTNVRVSITPELINVTTVGSGRGRNYKTRKLDWTVTFSGISHIVGDGYQLFDAIDNVLDLTDIKIIFTDDKLNESNL